MGYITVYSMEYASLWAASLARLLATHARSNVARSGAHKKATSSRGVTQTQAVKHGSLFVQITVSADRFALVRAQPQADLQYYCNIDA